LFAAGFVPRGGGVASGFGVVAGAGPVRGAALAAVLPGAVLVFAGTGRVFAAGAVSCRCTPGGHGTVPFRSKQRLLALSYQMSDMNWLPPLPGTVII
jgi:hypothetical protein